MTYSRKLPDFTSQTATEYKVAIDQNIAGIDHVVGSLAVNQTTPPSMSVFIDATYLSSGKSVGPWVVSDIGLPTSEPRVDVLYFIPNSGNIARAVGDEAATPTWPTVPKGVIPLSAIYLTPADTSITDDMITDIRPLYTGQVAQAANGYTNIVDPDGIDRIIIGRQGYDNRTIMRMHGGGSFEIQASDGTKVAEIDEAGNLIIKGEVQESALP